MKPFFSIIIPLYNKEKHIKDTLNSVLNQTYQDFEIIIVNDGSTDQSELEVKSIQDERIKLYTIENQGVSYARNYGVKKASSDFIVLLDADDFWKPNHLENLKRLQQEFPNCGLYATAYESLFDTQKITSIYYKIPMKTPWVGIVDDFFESSKVNCIAWTSAVMIPKHIVDAIGGFDERITFGAGEDTDLWMRVALKFPVAFNNTVSAVYHLDADNRVSNTNTNLRQFINLDAYETEAKKNKSLKIYLDLNRFSIAIQYKLAGNTLKAKEYIKKIDQANLNGKQRFLLKMDKSILRVFLQSKKWLQKKGIVLSAFR